MLFYELINLIVLISSGLIRNYTNTNWWCGDCNTAYTFAPLNVIISTFK